MLTDILIISALSIPSAISENGISENAGGQ